MPLPVLRHESSATADNTPAGDKSAPTKPADKPHGPPTSIFLTMQR